MKRAWKKKYKRSPLRITKHFWHCTVCCAVSRKAYEERSRSLAGARQHEKHYGHKTKIESYETQWPEQHSVWNFSTVFP